MTPNVLGLGLAAFAQVCENGVDAIFIDQAQSSAGNAQAHPTVFCLNPETTVLQVRQEPALGFVVGVGNIVPRHWAFARYVANACHEDTPILIKQPVPMGLVQSAQGLAFQPHLAKLGGGIPDRCACDPQSKVGAEPAKPWIITRNQAWFCSKKRWASSAAMQPVPALVMAWR